MLPVDALVSDHERTLRGSGGVVRGGAGATAGLSQRGTPRPGGAGRQRGAVRTENRAARGRGWGPRAGARAR